MVTIEAAITETIHRMRTTLFAWGSNDCDTIMADYVLSVTGKDPMAKWRGRYQDEAGAQAFVAEAGGNGALIAEGLASIGIYPRVDDDPKRGDVVILDAQGAQICGLFIGSGFTLLKAQRRGAVQTKRTPSMAFPICE